MPNGLFYFKRDLICSNDKVNYKVKSIHLILEPYDTK